MNIFHFHFINNLNFCKFKVLREAKEKDTIFLKMYLFQWSSNHNKSQYSIKFSTVFSAAGTKQIFMSFLNSAFSLFYQTIIEILYYTFSSVQFSHSVMSDSLQPHELQHLPVHHQLPEFTQTHVHRVGDAIQPSHPLSSPSPPALNPSQHQGLFQ